MNIQKLNEIMMRKVHAEVVDMSLQEYCGVIKVNNHKYDVDRFHVWKVTFRKDMELESDEYSGCYKFLRMYIFEYNDRMYYIECKGHKIQYESPNQLNRLYHKDRVKYKENNVIFYKYAKGFGSILCEDMLNSAVNIRRLDELPLSGNMQSIFGKNVDGNCFCKNIYDKKHKFTDVADELREIDLTYLSANAK